MSDFRGRGGRGGRGMRSRGGPPRGGPRGGSRGGYSSDRDGGRGGFSRGRGDGFSRGRGGPPPRHLSRDDSPPRKVPMMSRGRHVDRYEDSYDRRPPPRSRDSYPSPSRDTGRLIDRLSPPRSSLRDRDYGLSSRGSSDYPSSRGDYLTPRSYSPPRESGSYRDSYSSSLRELREDRRDSFSRPAGRDYPSARTAGDYGAERSRDFRDSPRDYGSSRDYPPHRGSDFRESLSGRGEFRDRLPPRHFDDDHDRPPRGGGQVSAGRHDHQGRGHLDHRSGGHFEHRGDTHGHGGDRDYTSSRFSSRLDDRVTSRGPPSRDYPPSREYGGRGGGSRGSMRGGRDDRGGGRGGFMNGDQVDVLCCSSAEKEIMSDNCSHLLELDQVGQSEVADGSSFPTDIRKTDWRSSTVLNIMDVQDRHQRSVGCQR